MTMQQEAEKRVREMQKKAREKMNNSNQPEEKINEPEKKISSAPATKKIKGNNLLEMLNFKSLLKENDTSIVVAILLMLSSDDIDPFLILALIYIVM